MKKVLFLVAVVIASGCTNVPSLSDSGSEGELLVDVNDKRITSDSPGEITLNARNKQNESSFYYTTVRPIGDYTEIVQVTDRDGNPKSGFALGEAPKDATTGQTFAQVQKNLNISSEVRIKIELKEGEDQEVIDSEVKRLRLKEED